MSEYQTVAQVGDIPEGEGRAFAVNGQMVAVFHLAGAYTAINDTCPHMGASLATGSVEDEAVTCPWHAWRFCVRSGTWLDNPNPNLSIACHSVRVEGGEVQVCVSKPEPAEEKPVTDPIAGDVDNASS